MSEDAPYAVGDWVRFYRKVRELSAITDEHVEWLTEKIAAAHLTTCRDGLTGVRGHLQRLQHELESAALRALPVLQQERERRLEAMLDGVGWGERIGRLRAAAQRLDDPLMRERIATELPYFLDLVAVLRTDPPEEKEKS